MTASVPPLFLLLLSILPLLLALGLMLKPLQRIMLPLAPLAALPAFVLSVILSPGIKLELPWLLFGSYLGFDETARVFLFFTSLLWLVAGIYSTAYFSKKPHKTRFFIYFLLAMTGNFGLILAQNLTLFYTFFAIMSFSAYGLVVHDRTPEALRAGRVYILLVVAGEILLFAGFILAAMATMAAMAPGSIEFEYVRVAVATAEYKNLIIALVLLGFGVKAGVIGLHVWLPLAHPVAPTPASAVLSGAMIAAGLLGWLRVLPLGEVALPYWGGAMVVAGVLAVFYAVLVGVLQSNAKTILAYSSISKMGLMTMVVGLGLLSPGNWPLLLTAILVFVLHHAFAKGALFLGVGMVIGPRAPRIQRYLLFAGLILPALALAGAPWTSGMIAKGLLKLPVTALASPLGDWLQILLPLSSVASSILMLRFLYIIWQQYKTTAETVVKPAIMWLSWLVLLLVVALNPWFMSLSEMQNIWTEKALISAFWPVVLGAVVAFCVWFANSRHWFTWSLTIPAGDVLYLVESRLASVLASLRFFAFNILPKWQYSCLSVCNRIWRQSLSWSVVVGGENQLRRWVVGTGLFLLLAMTILFLAVIVSV